MLRVGRVRVRPHSVEPDQQGREEACMTHQQREKYEDERTQRETSVLIGTWVADGCQRPRHKENERVGRH